MRMGLGVLLVAALVPSVRSQVDFDRVTAEIKYAIDAEGRVQFAPDVAAEISGGASDAFTLLVPGRFDYVANNAGVFGMAAYLFCGDTDLASLADGETFFKCIGRGGDADLLQRIAADDARQDRKGLQRLLAVRVAQDRGFKPAIGLLERVARQEGLDAQLRRAVDEARASFRGGRTEAVPELPRLEDVLADAPPADAHLRIDEFRLPSARPLLRAATVVAPDLSRQRIARAGWDDAFSRLMWIADRKRAAAAAVLPYELARRLGNARVHRVVLAVQFSTKSIWAHLDGVFDVKAIRAGLLDADLEVRDGEVQLACTLEDGIELTATPTRMRLHKAGYHGAMGREAAATLAGTIESDDAPIVVVIDKEATLPNPLAAFGRPERLAVWVPREAGAVVRAELRGADDRLPSFVVGEVRGFGDRLKEWRREVPQLEILERVYSTVRAETAGNTCTLSGSLGDVTLGALVAAIVRSGKLE